ncbi:uncharacterized protein LOC144435679 [Glandiceps talaboti]
MARRFGCVLLALWSLYASVYANGWLANNYPNPQLQPKECGRDDVEVNSTWVCDPNKLLEDGRADQLDDALKVLKNKSRCECDKVCTETGAYQVAIALARRMGIEGNYVPDRQRARDFAEDLRKEWFGSGVCQDNAVILYSLTEKELFIAIGKTTSKVVSDIELGQIYHKASDYFRSPNVKNEQGESQLYDGFVYVLTELHQAIDNDWFLTYGLAYAITISIATVLLFSTMCLIANCCPSQTGPKTDAVF